MHGVVMLLESQNSSIIFEYLVTIFIFNCLIDRKEVRPLEKAKRKPDISDSTLFAEYESVYHFALSLCHNESDAQDITQETFLKAMKAADRFEGGSSLYSWLCAIAKNTWLNKCHKQGREVDLEQAESHFQTIDIPVEQLVEDKEISFQIHKVLHQLDEPYKEIFSLRVFGQLPFGDIAELFSKSESWARVTYHRARKMIIEKLRKERSL